MRAIYKQGQSMGRDTQLCDGKDLKSAFFSFLLLCTTLLLSGQASAVPSYARQTGYACVKCHVGGFGPQLTPYGIKFKINAYTESDHKGLKIPVAAMIMTGFTHTETDQAPPPHFNANDNWAVNQISGFVAGRITDDLGVFAQVTYDGVAKGTAIDNVDIRLAHDFVIAKTDAILGVSVNNNPSVSDPGNTQPAWYFPYIGTAFVSGTGDAFTQLNGGLSTAVTGVSGYAFVDDSIYAEIGTYRALSDAMAIKFGEGGGVGRVSDATYWRLNYIKDMNTQAFSAGLIGFNFNIDPSRTDGGPVNRYRDIGLDASYMYLGKGLHNFTAYASYIREDQDHSFDRGPNGGGADNLNDRLYEFRFNTSYYYDQTYGVTLARFSTHGTRDATVYGFSATGSPDTAGTVIQIDWTPWGKEKSWARPYANARFGLQYTIYDKFDGASSNYDGAGRNASDNNTLFLFLWAAI